MSHIASVQCFVTDLDALDAVASRLGMVLERGATTYAWFGRDMGDSQLAAGHNRATFGTCLHKLRRADAAVGDYEIGLVARVDGKPGYEMLYDQWGHGGQRIAAVAGANLVTLKSELAAEVSTRLLARQGFRITRTQAADGSIKLTATGGR